jgi:hypothetical protein
MAKVIRPTVLALLALAFVAPVGADPGNDPRAPELTGDCKKLQVEEGNKVAFQASAIGVQIYRWNGTKWEFVAPDAILYNGNGVVATHYVGPTWESNSGSTVVGSVLQRCTPDPTAIPWLLLEAAETEGPGIFDGITFIQRINTVGGLAPAEAGEVVGDEMEVPYMADYVFYRKK